MKLLCKYLIITTLLLHCALSATADERGVSFVQNRDTAVTEHFSIYYKVDSIKINPYYLENPQNITKIVHYLRNSPRIDSIKIYAWASPEGGYAYNKWLSQERAKAAKQFLLKHSPDSLKLNSDKIIISPIAENWEGLCQCVEQEYFRSDRETVLQILHNTKISDEVRKFRLKKLDGGRTWTYLVRNYMPRLRAAKWTCVWAEVIDPLPAVSEPKDTLVAENKGISIGTMPVQPSQPVYEEKQSRTIAAVKTNLLYDAVTALNYSLEIPINKHFSLLYEQNTPWWLSGNNQYCLQFLSFGGEFRWWFLPQTKAETSSRKQRDAMVGHFLGANVWGGKADIQAGRDFGCYQFDFISAGLTYGYSLPISKYLNLEFSISAGYARIPYQHYTPTEDWQILIKDKNNAGILHYFGPTKAEISLVLPIRATIKKARKNE